MAGRRVEFDIIANDHASRTLGKVGDSADHAGGRLGKLGGVAKAAGFAIGGAAVGGVLAFGAALTQGIKDAASYQDLAAKSAAVLKSTGNAAGTSVEGIQKLAGSLESLSGVDEELIINSQNVLATFTAVQNKAGKGNDIFDQATKTALDLSTALGTDLQGASIQIGKALNDPIKGVGALSRVGVSFTAQQKDQIKAMVAAGDTMGAQKLILKELNKEFGGAAKAAGAGFNGSLARLKDTIGDTFRQLGEKLLPSLTKFANWLNAKAVPAVIEFGKRVGPGLGEGLKKAGAGIAAAWKIGQQLTGWVKRELNPFIRETVQKVMPVFKFALDTIRGAFKSTNKEGSSWGAALKVAGVAVKAVFGVLVVAVAAFATSFAIQLRVTKLIVEKVVIPAIKLLWRVVSTQFGLILDAAAAAFGWIPGIGPKLRQASKQFKAFRDSVNASLSGIHDKTITMRVVGRNNIGGSRSQNNARGIQDIRNQRAVGGYVRAGDTVRIGDNGPEFVNFADGGYVSTAEQTARMSRGGGSSAPTVVNNYYITTPAVIDSDRSLRRVIDQANARSRRSYVSARG